MNYGMWFCRFQFEVSYSKERIWFGIRRLVNGCTCDILRYNKTFKSVHNLFYNSPF